MKYLHDRKHNLFHSNKCVFLLKSSPLVLTNIHSVKLMMVELFIFRQEKFSNVNCTLDLFSLAAYLSFGNVFLHFMFCSFNKT